eukprot:13164593-Ditylum_brightwellii.AAC.1
MARSKKNRSRSCGSSYKKNRAVASIQPLTSNGKTGGTVTSSGVEVSGVAGADSSEHPANNPNTTVETSVREEVTMQGIVGTEGNPIGDSPERVETWVNETKKMKKRMKRMKKNMKNMN